MPEHDPLASKSEPEASTGEFDFATPPGENPRVKKRSLRLKTENKLRTVNKTASLTRKLEREASPRSAAAAATPEPPVHDDDDEAGELVSPPNPATTSQPTISKPAQPGGTKTETTSPHGTRPATFYYSTGANKNKNKETAAPMKTTTAPSAPTASAAPTQTPSSTRAAASPTRPATVMDYRANMERQAREQKSIGSILAIVVYVLIGFFVLGAGLAGYGLYSLSKRIEGQSVTIADLDKRYSAESQKLGTQIQQLGAQLQAADENLAQAQVQIGHQQALLLQEQEEINKLIAANDNTAMALRQERAARADEEADLRARIRSLEYRNGSSTTTQRY
ncbi:MAG TPA: hypothetical protein VL981_03665 [Candidatus Methylacidiphilales bacterium]|nr:hypothetical protein [Candidatus Methylacidiphilales bacterium]